jgi:hypothetical protein
MSRLFNGLNGKQQRDMRVLADFISIYCRQHHPAASRDPVVFQDERLTTILEAKKLKLCPQCGKLLGHGATKLVLCPYDPKPACKKCPTPCFAPFYRQQIRQVMRFSGIYLIKRGRLDLITRYLW